jgi:PHD/YefM family antitoxin component YafN of YafNO toxin-antitoxin module
VTSAEEWESRWLSVAELPLEERLSQLKAAEAELSAQLSQSESNQWQN